ncbi:hypothetical protein [Mangrovihabitans endophyticus]|uniref:Uncharacterized protein n=1 Tax=Mangrovihabitans endophyticus TaxID=1751298 RepID=A0A8J3FMK7_9ACTN|nr:hypothetical protein [Mangrovihabitans endophyticus]GGK76819.1 hypothetical protein GCM10012284_08480 [Mangrovihabitans endophyticus]
MTNVMPLAVRRYARATYGPAMVRRLGAAAIAVPLALRAVASRRFAGGILALPVAAAATGLTAALGWLLLINLAFPFRPYLGLGDTPAGGFWASTYHGSWGGPTLAGAWSVHGLGTLLLVAPPLAWAVRGLMHVQDQLTGVRTTTPVSSAPPVAPPAVTPRAMAPASLAQPTGAPAAPRPVPVPTVPGGGLSDRAQRVAVVGAALLTSYLVASLAHVAGIGDNVLWLPHNMRDAVALVVVLAPLAVAAPAVGPGRSRTRH